MGVSQPDPITGHPKRLLEYKRGRPHFKALIYGESRFWRSGNQIAKTPAGFAAGVYDDGMQPCQRTGPSRRALTAASIYKFVA